MDDILTATERTFFLKRYGREGSGASETVDAVITTAFEYADKHCHAAPPAIRNSIARVFINFILQSDAGEKQLLMRAIDDLIELGKAHAQIT
jgi:hypothetical protein